MEPDLSGLLGCDMHHIPEAALHLGIASKRSVYIPLDFDVRDSFLIGIMLRNSCGGFSMQSRASILVVDDDPVHLCIYGWIMNAAGFRAVTAQVPSDEVCLPDEDVFDVVVLDYRLTGTLTAVEAARQIQTKYPNVPIVILSDMFEMPDDIAPYASKFVRKGEPEKLIATISGLLADSRPASSGGHAR
jgi:CheY-like chemotaxis protein